MDSRISEISLKSGQNCGAINQRAMPVMSLDLQKGFWYRVKWGLELPRGNPSIEGRGDEDSAKKKALGISVHSFKKSARTKPNSEKKETA
jgi:hypothetical protein